MVRVEKSTDPIIHRHASYNSARRLLITVVETGSPSAWNSEPTRSPLARERKMRRIVVEWGASMADLPCRRSHVPSRARAASDSPALSPSITYVVASVVSGVCCTHRPARCGDNGQEASIARQIECCHYAISGPVAAVDSHSYFLQFDLVAVALISKFVVVFASFHCPDAV
jgi:hypothetical protein